MKKEEEYTGRSLNELRKVKVADMTGEELAFLQANKEENLEGNILHGAAVKTADIVKGVIAGLEEASSQAKLQKKLKKLQDNTARKALIEAGLDPDDYNL